MTQEPETDSEELVESQGREPARKREEPSLRVHLPLRRNLSGRWYRPVLVAIFLFVVLVVGFVGLFGVGVLRSQANAPFILAMSTTLSGPQAGLGREALQGVQLYLDAVNRRGGVQGHPLHLLVFDDKDDPATAQQVAHQVITSPALLMLGPLYSSVAVSTNPIYRDAHLPLISASATNDSLTQDNPYFFRLGITNTQEANVSATYAFRILGLRTASIVYTNDASYGGPEGTAFANTFAKDGGVVAHTLPLTQAPQQRQQALESIVTTLVHDPKPGIIFLAMLDTDARQVIVALRRHGITAPILGTDSPGSDAFASSFASYPEEGRQPGYFTDGLYASSPLLYDSAPSEAQSFSTLYQQTYGTLPGWHASKYYDAALVAVAALQAATIGGTAASLSRDRAQIAQHLGMMTSPQTGVEGLDGPLYFDSTHNGAATPIRFGQFSHNRFLSAPLQLVPVTNLTVVDLPKEERAGTIIQLGAQYFWKQRAVYTGIELNSVSNLNVANSTFTADFYLWMRYSGSDDATAITFPDVSNVSAVSFDPSVPVTDETINGLHYRLYHITGDFKANYDFHDYPFDQQHLIISFQNTRLTSDRLVYVIDAQGLGLRADNTTDPTASAAAFQSLSSWMYQSTQYASNTFTSRSTLGDPRLFDQPVRTDYSGLAMTVTLQRRTVAYLVNHLLALALLILLVYASLFLTIKHLSDRLVLQVTALLTGAVLLLSVNGELPEIGYVVSLDYIYYTFFTLCLLCMIVGMLLEWMQERKQKVAERRINIALHVTYLVVVAAVVIFYLVTYGNRFI